MRRQGKRFWTRRLRYAMALVLFLPLLSMPALATAPAAAEAMPADSLAYAGLWHASPVLGSSFSMRLALHEEHTFLWAASGMDGLERVRFRSGTWTIGDGCLRLTVEEEVCWEGGREVPASGSMATETEILDAAIVICTRTNPEAEEYTLGPIENDAEVFDTRTVTIGDTQYWALAHPMDLEALYEDYAAIKAQSVQTANGTAGNQQDEEKDEGFLRKLSGSMWLAEESDPVLAVGALCLFRNDEKGSTPYRWRYHISDESVIGFFHSEYELSAASLPLPGGDVGWRRFYFEALAPGTCELTFRYGRYGDAWDDEWDQEYRYTLVVTAE